jgi:hypothetical protein
MPNRGVERAERANFFNHFLGVVVLGVGAKYQKGEDSHGAGFWSGLFGLATPRPYG